MSSELNPPQTNIKTAQLQPNIKAVTWCWTKIKFFGSEGLIENFQHRLADFWKFLKLPTVKKTNIVLMADFSEQDILEGKEENQTK